MRPSKHNSLAAEKAQGRMGLVALLALVVVMLASPRPAWAMWEYEGAIDTAWYSADRDSFTISTAAQLAGLSLLVEEGNTMEGKTVLLQNDVDISGCEWEPIGSPYDTGAAFQGTFDGQGHEVRGLTIHNAEENQALFGTISKATICNLTVRGEVECALNGAGIVAEANRSNLSNLVNYANVSALGTFSGSNQEKSYNGRAAGVVAYGVGMGDEGGRYVYSNLVNYGDIRATAPNGNAGVIGAVMASDNNFFTISGCFNYGTLYVSAAQNVEGLEDGSGGVLGVTSSYGTYEVLNCGNEGDIFANNSGSVGGLIGSIRGVDSRVDHSYNTGQVVNSGIDFNAPTNDTPTAAGLISQFESEGGTVTNNYSTGLVSASSGYSAAIIGASTQNMDQLAWNNYYLEGSSTGAFNDWVSGESHDAMVSGEGLSQEELEARIDTELGGVAPVQMDDYELTAIDEAPAAEQPSLQIMATDLSELQAVCLAIALALLLAAGAAIEGARFASQRKGQVA